MKIRPRTLLEKTVTLSPRVRSLAQPNAAYEVRREKNRTLRGVNDNAPPPSSFEPNVPFRCVYL